MQMSSSQPPLERTVVCLRVWCVMQWASTLTQNGANLPFVSPLRADKLPNGFQVQSNASSSATCAASSMVAGQSAAQHIEGVCWPLPAEATVLAWVCFWLLTVTSVCCGMLAADLHAKAQ